MKNLIIFFCVLTQFNSFALTSEEKAKIVEKIYFKLYASLGTAEEKPKLFFDTKQTSMVAYMMNDKNGFPMIGFEEKAFDICATLGTRRDDAIAYLLGHEISHHTLKHHWGKQFASAYSVASLGQAIKGVDRDGIFRFETQADERGGILCYMSGFSVSGISAQLLKAIYAGYAIVDGPKYPTLDERIRISLDQDSIVTGYTKVFEAANYAMMLKEYDTAIEGYEYLISKSFHSREIYNNLGVIYFLKASSLADEKEMKFAYPIEIDLESIKSRGGSKGFGADVTALFEKALEKFNQAALFDKTYSSALLNQGCIHSILGRFDEARVALNNAELLAKKENALSVKNNIKLTKALVELNDPEGDKSLANAYLNELVGLGHDYAIINKSIVDGKPLSEITLTRPLGYVGDLEASTGLTRPPREYIENIRNLEEVEYQSKEIFKVSSKTNIEAYNRSKSSVYLVPFKQFNMIFHTTVVGYDGVTAKGLKIGTTDKELLTAYGVPKVIVPSRQGWIYMYPDNKLFFFLDGNKTIQKWVVYAEY